MGYSGAQIYELMNANPTTTETMDSAQVASHQLKVKHETLVSRIARIQDMLDSAWQGDAAAKANTGMLPLVQTSQQAANDLNMAKDSMYNQNSAFHGTRGGLVPVATERPDDSGLGSIVSIGASDAEKAAAQWNSDNQHNIRLYEAYAQNTDANRGVIVRQYPELAATPSGRAVGDTQPADSVTQSGGSGPYVGSGSGYNGPTSASGYSGGTGAPFASAPQVQSPAPAPPPQTQVPPAANWQPPGSGTTPSRTAPTPPSQQPGYQLPPRGGTNPPRNPGFGPPGGGGGFGPIGPGGGPGSGTGGFGPRGGGGAGGGGYGGGARGFGPMGGSAGGAGGPGGGQPGMGRGTGAVMPGENAAARGGAAGSAGASGGRGGGMMGGPMGAGGRGGKGGEDEEHQRKITLPGDDPDSLFGGSYERTTPPVIGEQKN